MRLIDADEIGLTDLEIVMCNGDYKEALKMLIDKISNQPTTYDLDKVVKELEERKEEREKQYKTASMEDGSYMLSKCFSEGARAYGNAIEIVKQGSVADYVCEWTQSGDMAINPHTFSKYKIKQCDGLYALSACPYCRKKIKVVE